MPQIKLLLHQIQVMEALQQSISETLIELKPEMSQSTNEKLLVAHRSLSIEIMMCSLRIQAKENPNWEEGMQS